MKKIVIFDFDGTLADTFSVTKRIFKDVIKNYGYDDLSDKEIENFRTMTPLQIIKKFKFPFWKIPRLINEVRNEFIDYVDEIEPFIGIRETIYQLIDKGFRLGILTSNNKNLVKKFLKTNNFPEFEFIDSELNVFKKSFHLKRILIKYKFKKKDVVYVGDEVRDIEACRDAKVDIISVSWGYNKKKILKKLNKNFVIDKPEQILSHLN